MNSISVFNNGVTQREPSAAKDIQSVAAAIRTAPLLKRLTGDYRSREAKEEREAFKKSLPLVTFSGVFTTRKNDALVSHSGYICVDLDHIGTPEFIKSVQDNI
ncbi:MAG TPA: BT4734/BF3469 family protein, partial [Bacteroidales bacterium]|nr:BT4734/BF3469 family protein [Bacteroidales bacterium]